MKCTVERKALQSGLQAIKKVVQSRNTIPILSNIKIETSGSSLRLTATNLDIMATAQVVAEVEEAGATTVSADTLTGIASLKGAAHIVISADEKDALLKIKAGRANFNLLTLPVADFPALEIAEAEVKFTLSADALNALVGKVAFAASDESLRFYLCGVYLHARGDGLLRAVATNGHQLAYSETPLPDIAGSLDDWPGVIVPSGTVALVLDLSKRGDDIEITLAGGRIGFACGDISVISKLVEGTFPDYERVIPRSNDKVITIDRQQFIEGVESVALVAGKSTMRAIKLSADSGIFALSANNPDAGSAREEIETDWESGSLDIGFNWRYLRDILDQIDTDMVEVRLLNPATAGLLCGKGNEATGFVLMPLRI